ncbi:gamma-tubulin complex component 3 homolog [Centruroides vittatus]|uniref:gamma-tubulin complex component 3 homolog n=1 Tax=Centruroides vittatus TaxID=120091 RepID=UPI00350F1EF4
MAHNNSPDKYTSSALVYKLCCHLTNLSSDAVTLWYQYALRVLGSSSSLNENDEFQIAEKIKKKLAKERREKDSVLFGELHKKLQTSAVLKNRCAVLSLLLNLSNTKNDGSAKAPLFNSFSKLITSTPLSINNRDFPNKPVSSNGTVSTIHAVSSSIPLYSKDGEGKVTNGSIEDPVPYSTKIYGSRVAKVAAMFSNKDQQITSNTSNVLTARRKSLSSPKQKSRESDQTSLEIPEQELLREVLYAFQGIKGNYIQWEGAKNNCHVDLKVSMPKPQRHLVLRLTEIGWFYTKIHKFCDDHSNDRTLGLVGQSFIAALQEELTEYYRLLAVLESQLQQETNGNVSGRIPKCNLTLHRLSVWLLDPFVRMKILASLVDACKGQKGGALASAVYSFLQHGDPDIRDLIKHILTMVVQPIYRMLSCWIFCGELEDTYGEFFVAANASVPDSILWQEKYSLRKGMVPAFFTMEQARKIMSTGKAINFLRQVCNDHTTVKGREVIKSSMDANNVESVFSQDNDGEFQKLLETSYRTTSHHVLSVLHEKYKFLDHLQAMRKYLLLGQGDFIRHLMDLLEIELAKPANMLYLHNLSGILESAIRATNAQFDNIDILQRLDVRLLEVSAGDTGWDVFSLDYHVDGPIGTVFAPQCMIAYLRLFNSLWRAKRMEYVLSSMWKVRTTHIRLVKRISELGPVLHHCHIILCEMIHFIQQMHYYIAFEVMECSWAELLHKVQEAQDLDQVIAAHEEFLDSLLTRALLDEESKDLLTQLRAIYDLIIQFQNIQEKFWQQANDIVEEIYHQEAIIVSDTEKGKWGTSEARTAAYEDSKNQFIQNAIPTVKAQLRLLERSYEDMVQKFLLMLTDHTDPNLRFLSFRLDFNEHYKSRNTRLHTSLTYQHRRRSLK